MITKDHISYLSKSDSILKKIIKENKIPKISKSEDYVLDLYKYIIFQQISTKAGNSIFNRFLHYYKANKKILLLGVKMNGRALVYLSRKKIILKTFLN